MVGENEISIQEMENQFYQGYPKWRKDEYKEQKQILERLISNEELEQYNSSDNSAKIQFLLNLLATKSSLESLEQLAIVTKVRQEMSSKDTKPDIKNIIQ